MKKPIEENQTFTQEIQCARMLESKAILEAGLALNWSSIGNFVFYEGPIYRISALLSTERLQTHVFTMITKIFVQ